MLKSQQKQTGGGVYAHTNVPSNKKIINKKFYLSWNHWFHPKKSCAGDHTDVCRIKIVDSSKLTTAKFLIYLFT